MITPVDLRPGDLMFGPIGGLVPGIFPVALGQLLLADRKARLTMKRWWGVRHVGVVTGAITEAEYAGARTFPKLVEAMPHGAREVALTDARWTDEYVYVRPEYITAEMMGVGDWDSHGGAHQGRTVAAAARGYVGTPYGFMTYAALAAKFLVREDVLDNWINRRVTSRKEMICSQLADQALCDAGFHVFDDGRLPQDVVPAELFRALLDRPGTQYVVPGEGAFTEVR